MKQIYNFERYVGYLNHSNIIDQKIHKNGINYKILCIDDKRYSFVIFQTLPREIQILIHQYLVEFMEIGIFLNLFIVVEPIHSYCCYSNFKFKKIIRHNLSLENKKQIIVKVKNEIQKRNRMNLRNQYRLFYFNNIYTNFKNFKNEILNCITIISLILNT